jgi:hypothetical protein
METFFYPESLKTGFESWQGKGGSSVELINSVIFEGFVNDDPVFCYEKSKSNPDVDQPLLRFSVVEMEKGVCVDIRNSSCLSAVESMFWKLNKGNKVRVIGKLAIQDGKLIIKAEHIERRFD